LFHLLWSGLLEADLHRRLLDGLTVVTAKAAG
jgi:hypothetical protein